MEEIWLPISETLGRYEVSNCGRIRSVFSESKYGKIRALGSILKTTVSKRGYEKVNFRILIDGVFVRKKNSVHRLVAKAFIPNPKNKPQINHKDFNQLNNHFSNLEWVTAKENTYHAQINGKRPMGVNRKKYIKKGLFKPIIDLNTGVFYNSDELAALFGIKRKYICRMLTGERNPIPTFLQYRYA